MYFNFKNINYCKKILIFFIDIVNITLSVIYSFFLLISVQQTFQHHQTIFNFLLYKNACKTSVQFWYVFQFNSAANMDTSQI